MQRVRKNPEEVRTSQISIRLTTEVAEKLEVICRNENKKLGGVGFDACRLYAELYPSLQMIKALNMNPDLTINEEELKKKIYDSIKKTF